MERATGLEREMEGRVRGQKYWQGGAPRLKHREGERDQEVGGREGTQKLGGREREGHEVPQHTISTEGIKGGIGQKGGGKVQRDGLTHDNNIDGKI